MNSWDDKNFVAAIEKTGQKKIVLAGLWTETCVALPTIQAIHDGYEIYVAEDCCGDVSQIGARQRHAAGGSGRGEAGDSSVQVCSNGSATGRNATPTTQSWIW